MSENLSQDADYWAQRCIKAEGDLNTALQLIDRQRGVAEAALGEKL